jgi:hypothetical protein
MGYRIGEKNINKYITLEKQKRQKISVKKHNSRKRYNNINSLIK